MARARRPIAPDPPDLPDDAPTADLDPARIEPGASWTGVRIAGADLGGARLTSLALRDAELDGVSLANANARGAEMRRVEVRACRMTGLLWNEGALRHVVLRD